MPSLWDHIVGSDSKIKQQRNYSKENTKVLEGLQRGENGIEENPLYQAGNDWLMKLLSGDTSVFEQPLIDQFNEEIAPGIAERFGGGQSKSSSAMNQTLAHAGSTLSSQIAKIRGDLMNQASSQALQYAQQPYSNQLNAFNIKPYENVEKPGVTGFLPTIANEAAHNIGKNMFGGGGGGGNPGDIEKLAAVAG
jgi:hypothetical protein